MTHITERRVVGNHADMGGPHPAPSRKSPTVTEILGAGVRRRAGRKEMGAAQSTWNSEGGAPQREATDGECGSASGGAEGSPPRPTPLGL
jgi:hypothetical protein